MVKTPKSRHSKSRRRPVTIDLDPASVSRVPDTAEGSGVTNVSETPVDRPKDESPPAETVEEARADAVSKDATAGESEPVTPERSDEPEAEASAAQPEDIGLQERMEGEDRTADATSGAPPSDEPPADEPPPDQLAPTPETRERAASGGSGTAFLAGIVGAVVALLVAGALQWAGVLPSVTGPGDDTRLASLQQQVSSLQQEMDGASDGTAVAAATQKVNELQETVASLQSSMDERQPGDAGNGEALKALESRLAALDKKVTSLADSGDARQAVDDLEQRIAQVQTALQKETGAAKETLQSNSEKLQSLDGRISALADKVEANGNQPSMARLVAATSLKSAIERGAPFAGALEAFAKVTPEAPDLSALKPFADKGIETRAELSQEVGGVASSMVSAASKNDPEAGYAEQLWNSARNLVNVRPVGAVEGNDVPAIVARFEADVKAGDYDKALSEYEKLPDDAKAAGKSFVDKLRARRAADTITDKALSDALKAA